MALKPSIFTWRGCRIDAFAGPARFLARLITVGPLCALLCTAPSTLAQGVIWFSNKVGGGGVDAPVLLEGTLEGPGPAYSAQLFLAREGSLVPLVPATVFKAAGSGAAAIASRYVEATYVPVPGVPSGESATLVMRAWETALGSYENASRAGYHYGQSSPFTIQLGGDPVPPALLHTLQPFNVIVPEPGSSSLFASGAAALAFLQYWRSRFYR